MNGHAAEPDPGRLISLLQRAHGVVVWVVGDVMLDEYAVGEVDRISPEAPVPVLRVSDVEYRLGGAANVARQVAVLGAHASLAGLVGHDVAGGQILKLCAESGIDARALHQVDDRPTSRKLRVLARNQQIVRLDWEAATPCPAAAAHWMIERIKAGRAPDIVILSDYSKGVLTNKLIAGKIYRNHLHGLKLEKAGGSLIHFSSLRKVEKVILSFFPTACKSCSHRLFADNSFTAACLSKIVGIGAGNFK